MRAQHFGPSRTPNESRGCRPGEASVSCRRRDRLTRWILRLQVAGSVVQRTGDPVRRGARERSLRGATSVGVLDALPRAPDDVALHAGRQDHSARHLSPERLALGLELDDALTKLPILDERLWCIGGVNESGRSLALSGAVGTHPLGVGRPLPRPARSPLCAIHAGTVTTRRHGSLPDSFPGVTHHVTDHYPTAEKRLFRRQSNGSQGRTKSASSASSPKRTISSWLFRNASKISIVLALPSLTQIAFGGGPCRNAS